MLQLGDAGGPGPKPFGGRARRGVAAGCAARARAPETASHAPPRRAAPRAPRALHHTTHPLATISPCIAPPDTPPSRVSSAHFLGGVPV